MSGLRVKRLVWTVVFLGVTLAAIVMECVAGLWHPAGWTIPWTEYLARYVPWPVQLLAYVVLAVWLPFHFWRHDHLRGVAYKRGFAEARRQSELTDAEFFRVSQALAEHRQQTGAKIRDANEVGYADGYADALAGKPHRNLA